MSVLEFVESLNDEIHHFDLSVKKNALNKLSKYLSEMSFYTTNAATIDCLVTFYVNLLTEHYDMLNAVIEGIMILMDFSEFSDEHVRLVAKSIVQMDVSQLNASVRVAIFDLFERLFTFHLTGMRPLNTEFIRDYMTVISGESEPQCVLRVMRINTLLTKTLNIDNIYEELFESVSVYFPIEFKTNKSSGSLTRIELVEANKRSMVASTLFGAQLFPVLMEKLSSEVKSARLDSLDILAEAIVKMKFEDVLNYYLTFIDMLYFEYKNREPEIQQFVVECLQALSSVFQQKASETQLLEYCWHLFEKCYSAVNNDSDVIKFLLISINKQSRIWSGFLAYFLPKIMEKLIKEDLEDLERLDNLTNVLSACENLSQYKGLLDNQITKTLFTKLTLLYFQIDEFSNILENNNRITVLFKLLSVYSLFNVAIPQNNSDVNFITDGNIVIESQVALVSKAINYVAISGNELLENAVMELLPKMIENSFKQDGNPLVNLIVHLSESDGVVQCDLSYMVFRSLPVSYIEVVFNQILKGIKRQLVRESVTSCLAVLVERFNDNCDTSTRLSVVLTDIVEYLLGQRNNLSRKNIENIGLAIANLGETTDETSKVQMVDSLLRILNHEEPQESTIIWLSSAIGKLQIETISKSVKPRELLNMLLVLIISCYDRQMKFMLCQTFASLVNKSAFDKQVEVFVMDCLSSFNEDAVFLLYTFKAAVYVGHNAIISKIIGTITSTKALLSTLGHSLRSNIEILSTSNDNINNHFCTETKLFPTRTLFYEQQIYHLLAQRYQEAAVTLSNDLDTRDVAMELYLKLVDGFSEDIMALCSEEMRTTIVSCIHDLSISTSKVSLQLQVLKSFSNLKIKKDEVDLTTYTQDIAKIVVSIADQLSSLTVNERVCLAKCIGCFSKDLQQECSESSMESIKKVIKNMLNDRKRMVRMEIERAVGLLL